MRGGTITGRGCGRVVIVIIALALTDRGSQEKERGTHNDKQKNILHNQRTPSAEFREPSAIRRLGLRIKHGYYMFRGMCMQQAPLGYGLHRSRFVAGRHK
jgi:hypothetical protein